MSTFGAIKKTAFFFAASTTLVQLSTSAALALDKVEKNLFRLEIETEIYSDDPFYQCEALNKYIQYHDKFFKKSVVEPEYTQRRKNACQKMRALRAKHVKPLRHNIDPKEAIIEEMKADPSEITIYDIRTRPPKVLEGADKNAALAELYQLNTEALKRLGGKVPREVPTPLVPAAAPAPAADPPPPAAAKVETYVKETVAHFKTTVDNVKAGANQTNCRFCSQFMTLKPELYEDCKGDSSGDYLEDHFQAHFSKYPALGFLKIPKWQYGDKNLNPECVLRVQEHYRSSGPFAQCWPGSKSSPSTERSTASQGQPQKTLPRAPCLSAAYHEAVYASFVHVAACYAIPQGRLAALIARESGFHINAISHGTDRYDAGLMQLTTPAIDAVNDNMADLSADLANRAKSNEHCKEVASQFKPIQHSEPSKRCEAIAFPANPVSNLVYGAMYMEINRSIIERKFEDVTLPRWLNEPLKETDAGQIPGGGAKTEKDKLFANLTMLMHKAPVAVTRLKEYIRLKGNNLRREDLDFSAVRPGGFLSFLADHYFDPVEAVKKNTGKRKHQVLKRVKRHHYKIKDQIIDRKNLSNTQPADTANYLPGLFKEAKGMNERVPNGCVNLKDFSF